MKFDTPIPDLQVTFYERLNEMRSTYLLDALLDTVADCSIRQIDSELASFVEERSLQKVAGWGLRGEVVFAIPSILRKKPHLLGYYRLLLGFSQKQFYGKSHGLGPCKTMEVKGALPDAVADRLEDLCVTLCASAEYFVSAVPELSRESIHELTLLTVGPQLRGGALNRIGQKATREVFELIRGSVARSVTESSKDLIELQNAAGDPIRITFASDPDIAIYSELPSGRLRPIIAVEIKGGKDVSNVHNRIGEAEKSHQKARNKGFPECWTIVGVSKLDLALAGKESPSTNRFFLLPEITEDDSDEASEFVEQLHSRLGLRA